MAKTRPLGVCLLGRDTPCKGVVFGNNIRNLVITQWAMGNSEIWPYGYNGYNNRFFA